MGSSNSTRRITVPNEEASGVIKLSDSVADRLKGPDGEAPKMKCDVRAVNKQPPPLDIDSGASGQYAPPGSLLALQIRQEKLKELMDNDEYWKERLRKQSEAHRIINRHLQNEYDIAVAEVESTFMRCPESNEVPCTDAKNLVLECYRKNAKSALNCSKEVQEFQQCVDKSRYVKIESRG